MKKILKLQFSVILPWAFAGLVCFYFLDGWKMALVCFFSVFLISNFIYLLEIFIAVKKDKHKGVNKDRH